MSTKQSQSNATSTTRSKSSSATTSKPRSFDTLALHAGRKVDPATGARAVPTYATSSFVFDSPEHAADLFGLRPSGNSYTRINNPTTDVFEQRIAALEGGVAAVATSSGQAAQTLAILNLAETGDNIIASQSLYGGTVALFAHTPPRLGIRTRLVDIHDHPAVAAAADHDTRAICEETVGTPALDVPDLRALAALEHRFIKETKLFSLLANVGDAKSLVIHPWSTTHQQLSEAERASAGVTADLVRLSVGLEGVEDLIADLDHSLAAAVAIDTTRATTAGPQRNESVA